ncbi:response regulator PleD [compost metagenome]
MKVTISIGVATFPDMADSAHALFDHADQALYASKRGGRNRCTLYQAEAAVPAAPEQLPAGQVQPTE